MGSAQQDVPGRPTQTLGSGIGMADGIREFYKAKK
jgi:hypothetical protein